MHLSLDEPKPIPAREKKQIFGKLNKGIAKKTSQGAHRDDGRVIDRVFALPEFRGWGSPATALRANGFPGLRRDPGVVDLEVSPEQGEIGIYLHWRRIEI